MAGRAEKFWGNSCYLDRSLVEAVPVILTRKLDRLPHTISWESVQKLLAVPDQTTLVGKRDFAILRLVANYGLRIGQAIHLRVRDVDWRQGLIYFPAEKGCNPLSFPLLQDVVAGSLPVTCNWNVTGQPERVLRVNSGSRGRCRSCSVSKDRSGRRRPGQQESALCNRPHPP